MDYADIFDKTINNYSDVQSGEYNIEYIYKYFDNDFYDTVTANVKILPNPSDTIFNKYFHYSYTINGNKENRYIKYYNGEYLYVIIDSLNNQEYIEFDAHAGLKSPISGSSEGSIISYIDLLNKPILQNILLDTSSNAIIFDTLYLDTKYLIYKTLFKDSDEFKNRNRQIFINPSTYTIDRVYISVEHNNTLQVDDYVIKEIEFNKIDFNKLKDEFSNHTKGLKKHVYVKKEYKPLEIGTIINDFIVHTYPEKLEKTIDFKDKIVVLDFWYTACFPCAKSIPEINILHSKYNSQIEFYAINMSHQDFEDISKVKRFTEFVPINYQIVFGQKSLIEELMILGYPSIYIFKNGKLEHIELGYNPESNFIPRIEQVLDSLIMEK